MGQKFVVIGATLLLGLLCAQVALDGYPAFNQTLFLSLNRLGAQGDWFWQNLTSLGEGLVAFVLVSCCARTNGRLIWLALLAALIAGSGSQWLKHLFDMPRPAALLDLTSFHLIGAELRAHAFPSGHATTALVAGGLLAHRFPIWRGLIYAGALLIALSRIAVGAHWPFDVLAGACLGYLSAELAVALGSKLRPAQRLWSVRLAWGLLLVFSVYLAFFELDYPQAWAVQWVAVALGIGSSSWRLWQSFRRA